MNSPLAEKDATPQGETINTTTAAVESAPNMTSTALPLDPSMLGKSDPDELQACIISKCMAKALACGGDPDCAGFAGPLATDLATMTFSEKLKLVTQLSRAAKNNPTIHSMMQCIDNNCGSCTVTLCSDKDLPPAEPATEPSGEAEPLPPQGESEPMPPQDEMASSAKARSIAALPSALLLAALGRRQRQ